MPSPDKLNQPSRTHKTEYGYFIRQIYTLEKKRRQKTLQLVSSKQKVILEELNGLQVYCYPHDFPDTIFFGIYPLSVQIRSSDIKKVMAIHNKIRWFLRGNWQKKTSNRKGVIIRRRSLQKAYNLGLEHAIERKNKRFQT